MKQTYHLFDRLHTYFRDRDRKTGLFFVVDDRHVHGGLVDQIKPIIGLYWIAKMNGLRFYIVHDGYYDIRDYLEPGTLDWRAEREELIADGDRAVSFDYLYPVRSVPVLKDRHAQYQCSYYYPRNILDCLGIDDWQDRTAGLFEELFRPGERLKERISAASMPDRYRAVHVRFVNSLGRQDPSSYNAPLQEEAGRELMKAVLERTAALRSDLPLCIFSDSSAFLQYAEDQKIDGLFTAGREKVGHIETVKDPEVHLKALTDFYLLSGADEVFSVRCVPGYPDNVLYGSQFSRYAAIIGRKPFHVV